MTNSFTVPDVASLVPPSVPDLADTPRIVNHLGEALMSVALANDCYQGWQPMEKVAIMDFVRACFACGV